MIGFYSLYMRSYFIRAIYSVVRYYKFVHIENSCNKEDKEPATSKSIYILVQRQLSRR